MCDLLRSRSVWQKFKTTWKFIPMRMDATVDAIDHVSNIWLSVWGCGPFNTDGKACFDQINSRRTHWPKNSVVLSQGAGETILIPKRWIEFTGCAIYRVASVKHGCVKFPLLPIINRVAYRLTNDHRSLRI